MLRVLFTLTVIALLASIFTSCTRDTAWRVEPPADCSTGCDNSYIERHEDYELAFVEFSERGNQFDRRRTREIMQKIRDYSNEDNGVAVVVFVHGWLHNASAEDRNVKSFRQVLDKIGSSNIMGDRPLVGLYVGWRGKSLYGAGSEYLTYWGRKSVAQHVGYNGVTPLILELADIDAQKAENILLIAGHSFGGAMTLSAVDNILLTRMADGLAKGEPVAPLAEGLVLLNPAIEANQIFSLKEQSMRFKSIEAPQIELLHVISSEGDKATHVYFPLGQSVAALGWNEIDFSRYYDEDAYHFKENSLDINTVGNYERFWTNKLELRANNATDPYDQPLGEWEFHDFCAQPKPDPHDSANARLPCTEQDPVVFLTTDPSFIKDHGDVFNDKVSAYMIAIVSSTMYQQSGILTEPCSENNTFSFNKCFKFYLDNFNDLNADGDQAEQMPTPNRL